MPWIATELAMSLPGSRLAIQAPLGRERWRWLTDPGNVKDADQFDGVVDVEGQPERSTLELDLIGHLSACRWEAATRSAQSGTTSSMGVPSRRPVATASSMAASLAAKPGSA